MSGTLASMYHDAAATLTPATDSFSKLTLRHELLTALDQLGYRQMTAIQAAALPALLSGQDVCAQAQTGSGKTLAYALCLLNQAQQHQRHPQALVLCPTRELAAQSASTIRTLARGIAGLRVQCLAGGAGLGMQARALAAGAHVVIATPGRLRRHLSLGHVKLDQVHCLVLDEADRMLSMGFLDEVSAIVKHLPEQRQSLLFSATYEPEVLAVSQRFQRQPQQIRIDLAQAHPDIQQLYYEVQDNQRFTALLHLLSQHQSQNILIFCNTKQGSDRLGEQLMLHGYANRVMHGDLDQDERNEVLLCFANGSCPLVIATDVAARGLDIRDLNLVINYELANQAEMHIHRIGRTGRAGKGGLAISLYSAKDLERLERIQSAFPHPLTQRALPLLQAAPRSQTQASMRTIHIAAGRKNKLRPTDILGALTQQAGIPGSEVGKIDVLDFQAYVAVQKDYASQALTGLRQGTIKGRKIKVALLA